MLGDSAELTKSVFTPAYTALVTDQLVPQATLWLLRSYGRHVQGALTMNFGFT